MTRMREEMRKVKNLRVKPSSRDYTTNDFDDIELQRKIRGDCTSRMETGILRSDMVANGMVHCTIGTIGTGQGEQDPGGGVQR